MSTDGDPIATPVNENKHGVTTRECAAMRILARDGWHVGELRMTMQLTRNESVYLHVRGTCQHQHDRPPLPEWDGTTPPARLSARDRA